MIGLGEDASIKRIGTVTVALRVNSWQHLLDDVFGVIGAQGLELFDCLER